jgi:pilus assembly protein Flp/PilA
VDGRGCARALPVGDLKLAAGVGAWIGPSQFWRVFMVTAIVMETCVSLVSRGEGISMKDVLLKIYVKAQILHEDYGQDLIEYALVVALIAFAATAGMSTVANQINVAFGNIGNKVAGYTT